MEPLTNFEPPEPLTAEELDEIYEQLPGVHCKGLCAETCHEPVPLTLVELARIEAEIGGPLPGGHPAGPCPLLDGEGRCSAYASRPMVCRIWGAEPANPLDTEPWRCPHGCEIFNELTWPQFARIAGRYGHQGTRSTNATLNRKLDELGAYSWRFHGEDLVVSVITDDSET